MERYAELKLWNGNVPFADPADTQLEEHFLPEPQDGIERLTDVTVPTITFYPVSGKGPHPAILVCPGGGYGILAWNHEGIDICSYFNSIGFSAFLLKYRCPDRRQAAHADACRAMRYIRAKANEFNILPDKVGIMGFSAGAHLSATVSAPADEKPYEPVDEIDKFSCKPDFTALIYPAYLCDETLKLAPEFKIQADTPPCFLLQTEDDGIQVENALAWFWAMKKAGAPAELHCYSKGGHGYGILRNGQPVADWVRHAADWFHRTAGIK